MADRFLYYCPSSRGGLADYAVEQCRALTMLGVDLTVLVTESSPMLDLSCRVHATLLKPGDAIARWPRQLRQVWLAGAITENVRRLTRAVEEGQFRHVLLSSYGEYAAPLWALWLRRLARKGVCFSAVLHDPFRSYIAGPAWWHAYSIRQGYSFLRYVFVHEAVDRVEAQIPPNVEVVAIPHAPYSFPAPTETRGEVRERLGLPAEARVFLSFGQIRDGKNLNLVLRAMAQVPEAWLVVAGPEAGGIHCRLEYYRGLADELGVADRCRWLSGFVGRDQVGALFRGSDFALLTYGRSFRSASGVLNAAVWFHTPCLASGGMGNLRTDVERYGLGIWVEPDNVEEIASGLRECLAGIPCPRWADYVATHSWRRNAELVLSTHLGSTLDINGESIIEGAAGGTTVRH